MVTTNKFMRLSLLAFTSIGLAACGGDDSNNSTETVADDIIDTNPVSNVEETTYQTLQVNAADYEEWKYISLVNGSILELTDDAASTSTDWHVALRRTAVKLNGGVSGPGAVVAAVADTQAEFYDSEGVANASVFTNADADIEAEALDVAYDLSILSFTSDSYEPAMTGWYAYDFTTHQISADTSVGYLIRHADNATYSKLFIDAVSYSDITVRYTTQAADTSQFADSENTFSASFAEESTELCLDLDAGESTACTNDTVWDLRYEVNLSARAINIWTNGGVYGAGNGAVFGPTEIDTVEAYTSATIIDSYDISGHYTADSSLSIFSDNSWYAYNLTGEHKLWPNFRTYIIDFDSEDETSTKLTFQVSNYYSLGGSGSPEIRFQELNAE
jgi:hypothetical protein|tara:strand:+ start:61 stop:1227 length:1167 start_codon:yes stop_codon:yes gene_type:complete